MTAFIPGIVGAATLPRWAVLVVPFIALPFMGPIRFTAAHLAGGLFVLWAALSLAWSPTWFDGVDALLKLVILAGIFMVGGQLSNLRQFYAGAAAGIAVSSLLAFGDLAGFRWMPGHWGGGLFINPLYLAEAAALVTVACIGCALGTRRWLWALLGLLPPILLPLMITGRGPLLALAVAVVVIVGQRRPFLAMVIASISAWALGIAIWLRWGSVADRFGIWLDTVSGLTWLGRGYGSFFGVFPKFAAHLDALLTRFDHAHNLWLETAFDLGPIGVVLLAWFFWLLLRRAVSIEWLVVVAFLVEATFAFPDKLPATAGMVALVAGFITRGLPAWRLSLVDGRIRLCARDGDQIGAGLAGRSDGGGTVVALRVQVPDGSGPAVSRARWPFS